MVQSFYMALQERINKENAGEIEPDNYMVEKVAKNILSNLFGAIGLKKIKVSFQKNGILYLNSAHSVWRSEVKNNLWRIKNDLNKTFKNKKKIKIIISN